MDVFETEEDLRPFARRPKVPRTPPSKSRGESAKSKKISATRKASVPRPTIEYEEMQQPSSPMTVAAAPAPFVADQQAAIVQKIQPPSPVIESIQPTNVEYIPPDYTDLPSLEEISKEFSDFSLTSTALLRNARDTLASPTLGSSALSNSSVVISRISTPPAYQVSRSSNISPRLPRPFHILSVSLKFANP